MGFGGDFFEKLAVFYSTNLLYDYFNLSHASLDASTKENFCFSISLCNAISSSVNLILIFFAGTPA